MTSRQLSGRTAIVVGGGQTPGESTGNGRATAITFGRAGAAVLVVDRNLESAQETARMIEAEGGTAVADRVDVTDEADVRSMVQSAMDRWGRIDILHNNVGISITGHDAGVTDIDVDDFNNIIRVNLTSMVLTCKHTLPVMRDQRRGAIVNISSTAVGLDYPSVGYRTSKAAVVTLTQHLAIRNSEFGVRANVILPGLINTPMAVENRIGVLGDTREEVIRIRDANVPLLGRMGTAWDVANAALFLASDDAAFITGAVLPVDGGQLLTAR